ncbi:hypothetical protein A2U01_0115518, partial [Trifolium medium]|nr:hypothetical protein [Trifolium medium]
MARCAVHGVIAG